MTKATNKAKKERFTFCYGNYIYGNGIYIIALDDDGPYGDVTINLYPQFIARAENNEVFLPHTVSSDLHDQFRKLFVAREIRTVNYGNYDAKADLVILKPEWKSICKKLQG